MAGATLIPLDQEDDSISPKGSLIHIGPLLGTASPKPTKNTPKAEAKVKSQPQKKQSPKK
jgi:hypothetical protein